MTVDALTRRLPGDIWLRTRVYDAKSASRWKSWLSPEERACLAEFGATVRQREFLTGRAAARHLLAEVLDTTPGSVRLRRGEDGGVDVEQEGWYVSISHSAERAVAACAQQAVGVDLEEIKPRDAGVARFLLHPDNRRDGLLDRLPYSREKALILCWTLKEAVLKAHRSGVQCSPKRLRLEVHPGGRHATIHGPGERVWRGSYEDVEGFMLSVAHPLEEEVD